MCLFGYHAQIAGIYSGAFPAHLPDLPAFRHRHVEASDTSCAGSALSMRRNRNGRERRDEFAWAVRDRRSCVYRIARSKPACEQLAVGRFGGGASHRDYRRADAISVETKNPIAGMAIGK